MRQFKENSITERNITKREYGRSSCNPAHFWCSKGVIYAFYSGVCALIMSSFKSPKFVFCLLAMVDLYESEIIYPISLKKVIFWLIILSTPNMFAGNMYIRMRHKKPTTKQRNEIKKMLTELLVCLCMYIIIGANKRRSKYDFWCQSRASLPALFCTKKNMLVCTEVII